MTTPTDGTSTAAAGPNRFGIRPPNADQPPQRERPEFGSPQAQAQAPWTGTPQAGSPIPTGAPVAPPPGSSPVMLPYQPIPRSQGTDRLAMAGFVLSFVGFIFPLGVLSIVLSAVGLSRIKRNGGGGRRHAIAGLVLSGCWLALLFVAAYLGVIADRSGQAGHDQATGHVGPGVSVPISQLEIGDCIWSWGHGLANSLSVVPCSEPHQAQLAAILRLEDGEYPGPEGAAAQAKEVCLTAFPRSDREQLRMAQGLESRPVLLFSYPREVEWNRGARDVMCVLALKGEMLTGDLVGGGMTS